MNGKPVLPDPDRIQAAVDNLRAALAAGQLNGEQRARADKALPELEALIAETRAELANRAAEQ